MAQWRDRWDARHKGQPTRSTATDVGICPAVKHVDYRELKRGYYAYLKVLTSWMLPRPSIKLYLRNQGFPLTSPGTTRRSSSWAQNREVAGPVYGDSGKGDDGRLEEFAKLQHFYVETCSSSPHTCSQLFLKML